MLTIKCTKTAFFDCDDTLIKWRPTEDEREESGRECKWLFETLSLDEEGKIFLKENHETDAFIPHRVHIEQLKEHKRHGHTVVVWSAGGWKWAAEAVKMLGIEEYVDLVIEKPTSVYDDKAVEEFMPKAQWFKDYADQTKEKLIAKSEPSDDEIESPAPYRRSTSTTLSSFGEALASAEARRSTNR